MIMRKDTSMYDSYQNGTLSRELVSLLGLGAMEAIAAQLDQLDRLDIINGDFTIVVVAHTPQVGRKPAPSA